MRRRLIDPQFWVDSKLAKLSITTKYVFIASWSYADDEGYYVEDYDEMRATLFPYNPKFKIKKEIELLIKEGFIEIYNSENKRYHHIKNFGKYQKISHPTPSKIKPILENSRKLQKILEDSSLSKAKQSKDKLSKDKNLSSKVGTSVPREGKSGKREKPAIFIDPFTKKRRNNAFKELVNIGVNENVVLDLFKKYPLERIENQIKWLPYRKNDRNKAGLVVKAIKENYMIPASYEKKIEEERRRR